jgi:hypothetical protein
VTEDRREFCRYLWQVWSPSWEFTDRAFDKTATSWDNDSWAPLIAHAYLVDTGDLTNRQVRPDLTNRQGVSFSTPVDDRRTPRSEAGSVQ